MSSPTGTRAVLAALVANLSIAAAKFAAFAVTGSSAMASEGVHSLADSGNQVLLLVGGRRAGRRATPTHPFGYGRERYVYGFVVAIVLFTVGGLYALYEGLHKLRHPEELTSPQWAIGVLLFAIVAELFSFRTAVREARPFVADGRWVRFLRTSRSPELPVILLEDAGALIGLLLALVGVSTAAVTGDGRWDGLGSMAIGALLVVIAVFLAVEMKSLLVGEGGTADQVRAIEAALVHADAIPRVIHLKTLHLGPEELLVAAKVAVDSDDSAVTVARAIDAAEQRVRAAVPIARVIYLEPDVYVAGRDADPTD